MRGARIIYHPESETSYCSRHYRVVDGVNGKCIACAAESDVPRPTVWVDPHCVMRWQQRIDSTAGFFDVLAAVKRIATRGTDVLGVSAECRYFVHDDYPKAKLGVRSCTNAAVTVLLRNLGAD
jgi:hypothetical protein